jgi:hypothetical protein
MKLLIEQIDDAFIGLAWNLWNTLGVAGENPHKPDCLIDLEALVLLTSIIGKSDPRLLEEALDWCSKFHYFVSISRLKRLISDSGTLLHASFSLFAETLNSVSQTKWPTFVKISPLPLKLSGKSNAPDCKIPALLALRIRSLFGIGTRADLATFFLTHPSRTYTAADTTEIGYSKKTLADTLDSFVQSGLLTSTLSRNQKQYACAKKEQLASLAGELPRITPDWRTILLIFTTLRESISKYLKQSIASQAVSIANALEQLKKPLYKLNIPSLQLPADPAHWNFFIEQTGQLLKSLAHHDTIQESIYDFENTFSSLMQKFYRVDDCVDGLEFIISQSSENPTKHKKIFKECYQMSLCYLDELQSSLNDLLKFPIYLLSDIKISEIIHKYSQEKFQSLFDFIKNSPTAIIHPGIAFDWQRKMEQELTKIVRFIYEFKERLKELYLRKTDIHLLTHPPKLFKRHAVLKLFSSKP